MYEFALAMGDSSALALMSPRLLGRKVAGSEAGATKASDSLCFVAGTPVLTEDGYKAIEEIRLGDTVISRDEATGLTVSKPVVQLFRNRDKQILDVVLEGNHQTEVLGATPEHPFYVSDRGWVPAGELRPGDQVVSHASGEGRDGVLLVKAVNARPEREDTYNFEVAGTHTYFVGKLQAWVHNACGVFGTTAEATTAANKLGYSKVRQYPFRSHGQPVYRNGNRYITPDVDQHNGGVWKVFDRRGNRIGTADADLNIFKD